MSTASLLISADRCFRREFLEREWELGVVKVQSELYSSIELGLTVLSDDPALAAADHLMDIAVERGLDTNQQDLLDHAQHFAALAEIITWTLRTGDAWERVPSIPIAGHMWHSGAFSNGQTMRRVILVDRWDDERLLAESHSWAVAGECAVYGVPMDLYVVVLGSSRDGKRHGPFSAGYTHPIAKNLRFKKRDGEDFGETWKKVFREQSDFTREEWLEQMTDDGVLGEYLEIHRVECSPYAKEIRAALEARTSQIRETHVLPEVQLSACHDAIHPCPFRSCCPYFREPSETRGFIRKG